jgi:hypothetical protein
MITLDCGHKVGKKQSEFKGSVGSRVKCHQCYLDEDGNADGTAADAANSGEWK